MNILDAVVFYTKDVETAVEFYTKIIGLRLDYQSEDKYASFLFDNNVKLGIKKAVETREMPGSQTFFMAVEDAALEYESAKAKGLNIYKQLRDEPWAYEFSILDPDGNKIEFVQNK